MRMDKVNKKTNDVIALKNINRTNFGDFRF